METRLSLRSPSSPVCVNTTPVQLRAFFPSGNDAEIGRASGKQITLCESFRYVLWQRKATLRSKGGVELSVWLFNQKLKLNDKTDAVQRLI